MSDDNDSGPYRRDAQGFRTRPEDPNRGAHWYELLVFGLVRYVWVWVPIVIGLVWWMSRG